MQTKHDNEVFNLTECKRLLTLGYLVRKDNQHGFYSEKQGRIYYQVGESFKPQLAGENEMVNKKIYSIYKSYYEPKISIITIK